MKHLYLIGVLNKVLLKSSLEVMKMKAHNIMKKQVIKVKEQDNMQSVIEKFLDYG